MNATLSKIRASSIERQLKLKDLLRYPDSKGLGELAESQFRTIMKQIAASLTADQLNALVRTYSVRRGVIGYLNLLADVEAVSLSQPSPAQGSPSQIELSRVQRAIKLIQDSARLKKTRLQPHLKAFDKNNTGFVSARDFSLALSMSGLLQTDPSSAQALIKQYQQSKGVNYAQLCSIVDGPSFSARPACPPNILDQLKTQVVLKNPRLLQFFRHFDWAKRGTIKKEDLGEVLLLADLHLADGDVERLRQASSDDFGDIVYSGLLKSIGSCGGHLTQLDDEMARKLDLYSLLAELKLIFQTRRVHIKRTLELHDPKGSGKIPSLQFLVELNQISKNIAQWKIQRVADFYTDQTGFRYLQFSQDLDRPERLFQTVDLQAAQSPPQEEFPYHLTAMERLHNNSRYTDLEKRFKANDSHEFGVVQKATARQILDAIGITDEDYAEVLDKYSVDRQRLDYIRLLNDIEHPTRPKPPPPATKRPQLYIIERLSKPGLDLAAQFQKRDPHGLLRISRDQLREALVASGLKVSQEELRVVAERYNKQGSVNYQRLLEDIRPKAGQSHTPLFNTQYCINNPPSSATAALLVRLQLQVRFSLKSPQAIAKKYDDLGQGVLPSSQFKKLLEELNVAGNDAQLLEDYFSNGKGRVLVSAFLELFNQGFELNFPQSAPQFRPFSHEVVLSLDDQNRLHSVLKDLARLSVEKKTDVRRHLESQDAMRTGKMLAQKFKVSLVLAGLPVADRQARFLADVFSYGQGEVEYRDFCKALDHYLNVQRGVGCF